MAYHSILQHDRHRRVHLAGRDTGHGSFLAPSTIVHCIIHRRKYGALDHGVDV